MDPPNECDGVLKELPPPPPAVTSQSRLRKYKRAYLILAGVILMAILLTVLLVVRNQRINQDSATAAAAQGVGGYPSASPSSNDVAIPTSAAPSSRTRLPTGSATISVNDYVEQVILSASIFGGSEFADIRSYQSQALEWLQGDAADEKTGKLRLSDLRLIERYALACIYFATYAVQHAYTELE